MERREELLRAAARVYALHGYRGSTTRRIADDAGVNEITIFRQFGTKDALIHEAIACCGGNTPPASLPQIPVDPLAELLEWARDVRSHIVSNRSLIRRCMSEREEHPQLIAIANKGPHRAATELQAYFVRLQEYGFAKQPFDAKAPAAMLIGTLFADSMGRDVMPDIYPATPEDALQQYTRLVLNAVGVDIGHRTATDDAPARDSALVTADATARTAASTAAASTAASTAARSVARTGGNTRERRDA